jgi:GT2 family glycosyltransferase
VKPEQSVGVVVIGRNEGKRLERCLVSLAEQGVACIVYVDSGSTDGSPEMARARGVIVEDLDTSIPFTMSRGRNAGFRKLLATNGDLPFVQFVDGDCEVDSLWIGRGVELLRQRDDVVAVCGFRRERFPNQTVYNRLADMEWRGPTGELTACGGDAIYRVEAFKAVGGFNDAMIAGEEAALCARLRTNGGKIWRLNCPMTIHDAAMTQFSQWWKRNVRTGHAFAENATLQGSAHDQRQLRSIFTFGLALPSTLAAGALLLSPGLKLALWTCGLGLYARSGLGAYRFRRRLGDPTGDSAMYAAFCVFGKFPETQGALKFFGHHLSGSRSKIIEYKG